MFDPESTFLLFLENLDCPPHILEAVLSGYSAIFEEMSGTASSMYSDGIGNPSSDHALGNELPDFDWKLHLNNTDIDDSDQWNGGENTVNHPIVKALAINDLTKVTTAQPEHAENFHGTDFYAKYIANLSAKVDEYAPLPSHIDSDEGSVRILTF